LQKLFAISNNKIAAVLLQPC